MNNNIYNFLNLSKCNKIDVNFYKYIYNLTNLKKDDIHRHYLIFGFFENKYISLDDFYSKNEDFDIIFYKHLNYDLKELNEMELIKHYINDGIY
jgi:hypothetical protein